MTLTEALDDLEATADWLKDRGHPEDTDTASAIEIVVRFVRQRASAKEMQR